VGYKVASDVDDVACTSDVVDLVHGRVEFFGEKMKGASVMAWMWRLGVFDIVGFFGTAHGDRLSS
jgi:hypothetical protein